MRCCFNKTLSLSGSSFPIFIFRFSFVIKVLEPHPFLNNFSCVFCCLSSFWTFNVVIFTDEEFSVEILLLYHSVSDLLL